ncbi:uncharacterized protein LOC110244093 isoform X1 [Exaiptasia diaphana]|uniref:Uncharacterized protein n=1 Tax=Exaiptasia diaphana TaxID=2652724 RepID=A0A913XL54_EXADI|nr:uncharacterized protein LOC110244093 isoform X1 [Exaiptasia diaphana]KXJ11183.1 hypothetical protein AC249_AIPGENE11748 [Exaiptasia diaphana]
MESSSTKVTKVILPRNPDGGRNIVCEIDSKHIQVGDNNKVFVIESTDRGKTDSLPKIEILDLGESGNEIPQNTTVRTDCVQVITGDDSGLQIKVKSIVEDSTVQIGNEAELNLVFHGHKEDKTISKNVREPKSLPPAVKKRHKHKKKRLVDKHKLKAEAISRQSPPSDESIILYKRFFEEVLAVLHPLRDNGEWDLFYDKLNEFRSQDDSDTTWNILLSLEQAQQMCYHSSESNIVEAATILCQALKKIKAQRCLDPSITQLCEGRAYCYLASAYRHQKGNFHGRVNECLAEAQSRLRGTPFLYDEATVYYEKASFLLEFDKQGSNAEEIRVCLDKCAELCDEISKERKWDFVKKGHFAKLKKAMLFLNCTTNVGRKRRISDEHLEEAKKCLQIFETENSCGKKVPVSVQLQNLLTNSDKAFRCSSYHEAKEIIEEAIALATTHGFDETPSLKRRKDIDRMLQKESLVQQPTLCSDDDECSEQNGSEEADVSATTEDTE